jgi:ketosteroid isomerase-like protein
MVMDQSIEEKFLEFLEEERAKASWRLLFGDAGPLIRITAEDVTFVSPMGKQYEGDEAIEAFKDVARWFGGRYIDVLENSFYQISLRFDGDSARWVGRQHSVLLAEEGGEEVQSNLLLTEHYRYEDGRWKLEHRHASKLVAD